MAQRIEAIRNAGISAPLLPLSNMTGFGFDEVRALLAPGKTHCLLGSSGVGKTTLINRLVGREAFETKAVSETGEGVHTTARRHLLVLDCGAMLIDTPGMRELGLLGTSDGMDTTFRDIGDFSTQCRFPDCTHTQEPGCAVLIALQNGELSDARYQSYRKLQKEAERHGLSYAEKRKKDRAFGRFVKSSMKQMKGLDPEQSAGAYALPRAAQPSREPSHQRHTFRPVPRFVLLGKPHSLLRPLIRHHWRTA